MFRFLTVTVKNLSWFRKCTLYPREAVHRNNSITLFGDNLLLHKLNVLESIVLSSGEEKILAEGMEVNRIDHLHKDVPELLREWSTQYKDVILINDF